MAKKYYHFKKGHPDLVPPEARKRQSEKLKGKMPKNLKSLHGENHWNWKGGVCDDPEHMKELRRKASITYIHRKRASEGEFTYGEWELLQKQYGNKCACCREKKPLEADHIIPLSKGGVNTIENIQPLCRNCNAMKSAKMIPKYEY